MKKIIKYLDIEKQSAEFIIISYYSLTCICRVIKSLINGITTENRAEFFINLLISMLFCAAVATIFKAKEKIKKKLLNKNQGWGKWYPIMMITLFVLDGISAVTKITSGTVTDIVGTTIDFINFGVAIILIIGTIVNRFISKPEEEIKDENNL